MEDFFVERGSFQWMKSVNKTIILNKIRMSEPISRAQIAKETSLTPPTVSSIVKELMTEGLVVESTLGESSGGRKPTMLHINSTAFFAVGVDAGPETVECVLTDLTGKIYDRSTAKLQLPITNEAFIGTLKQAVINLFLCSGIDKEQVIGIGMAMHGVVDVDAGEVLVAPNISLRNIRVKELFEEEFGMTIRVENDARAMALGESWFGGHGGVNSMVAINIGRGVGAGLVLNGKLHHGAQGIAGEFGHMTIDLHGAVCECGNQGCLQTLISGNAIEERSIGICGERISGEEIFALAQAGSEVHADFLSQIGEMIGIGLTNLIHLLNPDKIVLGGGVMKSEQYLLPAIQRKIERTALTKEAAKTEVVATSLGDDATVLGAVSLLLVELFDQS